jgi:SWI/SNF-related matrix-associated actin-dependent regulator 1 of chromatin subfamily A
MPNPLAQSQKRSQFDYGEVRQPVELAPLDVIPPGLRADCVGTTSYGGRGWWALGAESLAAPMLFPPGTVQRDSQVLVPFTEAGAGFVRREYAGRLSRAAALCLGAVETGEEPPGAQLIVTCGVTGERLKLEPLWDRDIVFAFRQMPCASNSTSVVIDPSAAAQLDEFIHAHKVRLFGSAVDAMSEILIEHRKAAEAVALSRARTAAPIAATAIVLGGTLRPFQWAAVRYALERRSVFLADEQGLGKTVEALAAIEADGAYPAIIVCPASMKLAWERETIRWLPHRSVAVVYGRPAVPPSADITILNYEVVSAHREELARRWPRALVVDESHYCKNPHARRTQAVVQLAGAVPSDGLRLALSGTPILNCADELISQLRLLGRLHDFGSAAGFSRQFAGDLSEDRLHWHLRRRCFVRRLKSEVIPQLPAKRRIAVPVALGNESEYRLAERDVIAWLRSQPLDLTELSARVGAALRAQRLARLTALQRLAGRGKLAAGMAWIEDFLASKEPLVVFARHVEIQRALVDRFPGALHLLGSDSLSEREATIKTFQDPLGPCLLVCATRVAAQGITLTRASNVAFMELEWTPAMHDQAEDRCHRIGQRNAVSAWYLLAAGTIDETIGRLIQRKRKVLAAVTDGQHLPDSGLIDAVVRELRESDS